MTLKDTIFTFVIICLLITIYAVAEQAGRLEKENRTIKKELSTYAQDIQRIMYYAEGLQEKCETNQK